MTEKPDDIQKFIDWCSCRECNKLLMVHDNEGQGAAVCPDGHGRVRRGVKESDIRDATILSAAAEKVAAMLVVKKVMHKDKARFLTSDGKAYWATTDTSLSLRRIHEYTDPGDLLVVDQDSSVWNVRPLKKQPKQ